MYILGLNYSGYTSAAALIKDGKLIAGGAEERFNRQKYSRDFPHKAIEFCLETAGVKMKDIDVMALAWNPAINILKLRKAFSATARYRGEYFYSAPSHLLDMLGAKESLYSEQIIALKDHKLKIVYVNHHDAHSAHAFFSSPYKESAILTVDGFGERATTQLSLGKGNEIKVLKSISFPQSIGLLYATFTQFLGYHPDADEWKIMGAAPYGNSSKYLNHFKKIVSINKDGQFEIDLRYFNYFNYETGKYYNDKFISLFGLPRKNEEELTQRHFDIAASLQKVTEEILFSLLRNLHHITRQKNICLAGGVIMNSVFNGKVIQNTPFKNIFIPASAEDCGTCIGAALYTYKCLQKGKNHYPLTHDYWGPEWNNDEIESILKKYGIRYQKVNEIEKVSAQLIAEGKVIGRFSGRMEFGARALGNRSILADPRKEKMKERINAIIKYREWYRPFAPSILEEETKNYFEIDNGASVPFMEKVYMIRKEKRKWIPAVTHVDGTGRLQTVSKQVNPSYYNLIKHFKKITGIPVVLNTSFNLQGEPIVCTPENAIRTFYTSGLDCLTLQDYLIRK